ncbi:hypothetical protein ONZ45_g14151 [Pleurotus djamor]|nr:hypothetical protein ONZ45_g14151 [Pleurotus djamor]
MNQPPKPPPNSSSGGVASPEENAKPLNYREQFQGRHAPSQFIDPCEAAAKASFACMNRNDHARDKCSEYFQAYRDCKAAWLFKLLTSSTSLSHPSKVPGLLFAMSVTITPGDVISFKRPFSDLVSRTLTITNYNAEPIAFKVKTSAPLKYLARPNMGRIEPGQSGTVEVMLQANSVKSTDDTPCLDKFLIQSTIITFDRKAMSLRDIFAAPKILPEHDLHGQKLRVAYLPSESSTAKLPEGYMKRFTYDELEMKYKEALLEIERLRAQLSDDRGLQDSVRAVYIRPWMGSQGH